jgi:hypothetical protein
LSNSAKGYYNKKKTIKKPIHTEVKIGLKFIYYY